MSKELVSPEPKWRTHVPEAHKLSIDTRVQWLWNQRFGTLQNVYNSSPDILDRFAATMLLQAILGRDLRSIQLVFQRLEGGAQDEAADPLEPADDILVF